MAKKSKNNEISPVRNFFRRMATLGMLLAVVVLIYGATQESAPPPSSGTGTTFQEEVQHTAAYPGEDTSENPNLPPEAETTSEPSANTSSSEEEDNHNREETPETSSETQGDYPQGYVDMPEHPSESAAAPESTPEIASVETPPETVTPPQPEPFTQTTASVPETVPAVVPEQPSTPTPLPVSSDAPPTTSPLASHPATPPLKNIAGPPVNNFLEIFDFNVNPDWVSARWSYITTVGPLNTRGYRVPLCTGTSKSDLVGNLTYYFDRNLDVEKITFEGYTGDLDRLIITLRYFHMEKRMTADPNVLLYESPTLAHNYKSYMKSYFRTTTITENPNQRFWVTMELYPEDEEE